MKILILGAGQVGGTLAAQLAGENNDITVVDTNVERLRELQDRVDIATVCGPASQPSILRQAGAEDAEMLVAVTASDEVNMVACEVCHTLFHTPTKIARIRASDYVAHHELYGNNALPIDVIISPEQVVTRYIKKLLQYPGALQVLDFSDGKAQLVAVKAFEGGPLVGRELRHIPELLPSTEVRVAAIFRKDRPIFPEGSTVVEDGDEVFFIAAREHILPMMGALKRLDQPYKRVMIAGGGNIGMRLAQAIESRYQVKLVERSSERCHYLAEHLNEALVLSGNASDRDLMLAEGIADIDIFCALTNDDEDNFMASMLAKRLGAGKVITLITNPAYVDLVQGGEIDIAISPQLITVGSLLTHVRRGDICNVYSLRRGAAEALEIIAHGDQKSSRVVGRRIDEIKWPEGVTVGAVVRGDEVLMAHRHTVIENDDHVILFVVDKRRIKDVEKLFQVGFHFF